VSTPNGAEDSDFVVVGAGLAGAATAWQLALAGHEVTLVERGVPADPGGSSHGSARIFRYAYPDAFYADLVVRARTCWTELEQACGTRLVTETGSLDFGGGRGPVELGRVLEQVGVEHSLLGEDEARERWPGIRSSGRVLWNPTAGVIDAEAGVHAMVELAVAEGARLLTGWSVSSVTSADHVGERGRRYRVISETGDTLTARRVVVAAGGWLPDLIHDLGLPDSFVHSLPRLTVRQEQVFHFPYRDATEAWPTTIHGTEDMLTYSLPGGRDAGFRGQKLAEFEGGRSIGSAAHQDGHVDPANRARLVEYARTWLPGLVPEPYAETTCLFTMTPTEDFVLDRYDGLTVVSPCSGHGAKFAPLIGRLAAEAVTADSADEARAVVPGRFHVVRHAAGG